MARPRTERDRSRRVLAQNFLRDPAAVARLVRAAEPARLVLEAGAGEGVVTRALAERCRLVVAYEIDPTLATALAGRTRGDRRIRCVYGDFLAAAPPDEPFAVVANIPYAATARIVDWCLRAPALTSATVVTQLEYARKRTGGYGRWSMLTVRTWPEFSWRLAGRIGRDSFRPVPRVDAGILRLERRPLPLLPGGQVPAYGRFVDLGFRGVGGSLYASLCRRYPARRVAAAFRAARLDTGTPVGLVWPEQWLALFRAVDGG